MQPENKGLSFLFLLLDISILFIAIFIISYFNSTTDSNLNLYLLHASVAVVFASVLYSRDRRYFLDSFKSRFKHISLRMLVFAFALLFLAPFFLSNDYSTLFLLQYTGVFYLIEVSIFYLLYKYIHIKRERGKYLHNIVILGIRETDFLFGCLIEKNPAFGFNLIGYIADEDDYDRRDKTIIGQIDEIEQLAVKHQIEKLFITPSKHFEDDHARRILAVCNKVGLKVRYVMMNTYWNERLLNNADFANTMKIYNPQEIPLDNISNRLIKRMFDIIFSSFVILFLLSWLFPLIALIIKMDSRGPVFFRQLRTGIDNEIFNCLKFRTMQVNEHADSMQAKANDLRISRVGAVLRKYNIDELPQFFNVLFGHMSVVGPRPHMLKHTELYSELISHYKVRHYVKPGVTGWAQVNGYRGLTDELWKMEGRVSYDMEYLKNWNFFWDLKIIYLTIFDKDSYMNAM